MKSKNTQADAAPAKSGQHTPEYLLRQKLVDCESALAKSERSNSALVEALQEALSEFDAVEQPVRPWTIKARAALALATGKE